MSLLSMGHIGALVPLCLFSYHMSASMLITDERPIYYKVYEVNIQKLPKLEKVTLKRA